mgnify:CR=1 FL=1
MNNEKDRIQELISWRFARFNFWQAWADSARNKAMALRVASEHLAKAEELQKQLNAIT